MSEYQLPAIEQLPKESASVKEEALTHLFEPCSTLNQIVVEDVLTANKTFSTYGEVIEQVRTRLLDILNSNSSDPRVSKIIAAHPRLGAPKNVKLSAHSEAEQKNLKAASEEQAAKLKELNEKYEQTFPGLRYVVFVNGRPRDVIMENMKERIARNDVEKEKAEAFNAMCDIAHDRASKLLGVKSQL
jgi:2-oxo-4-hydroxy-4-carboxy--5-ureidoimidazoline (OHCU) decarboxylase